MADQQKTRKEIEAEKLLMEQQIALLAEQTDALRKVSAQNEEQSRQAVESHKVNLELVKIAEAEGDADAARDLQFQAMSDIVSSQAMVQIATLNDAQASRLDAERKEEQSKLDNLELKKEASLKERLAGRVQKKGLDKEIGQTPSFINKLAKLALGIVGVKVFQVMIKNFDTVKAFVNDKIIPATTGLFNFLKDTVFPFISNNFKEILNGVVMVAGAMVAFKVFTKILNAIRLMRIGFIAVQVGTLAVASGLSSMVTGVIAKLATAVKFLRTAFIAVQIGTLTAATNLAAFGSGILAKLGSAVKFLRAGFLLVTAFTMTTLVPALIGIVKTMAVALAPFLPIIIGVGLAIAGIVLLLNKAKEALGFDSVFDVMLFAIEAMKDGFARMANVFIKIAKKIAGMGSALLSALGIETPDFVNNLASAELFETDRAQKFRAKTLKDQERKKLEAEEAKKNAPADSEIPELPANMQLNLSKELKDAQLDMQRSNQPELQQSGGFGSILGNLFSGREDVEASKANSGLQVAMQNVHAPTTTNNSSSNAMYNDPTPAIDNLDGLRRFA